MTSQILNSLQEGEGGGGGVVHKNQHLIVVQMKERKSIFNILRIYSYFMLKVHTSVRF